MRKVSIVAKYRRAKQEDDWTIIYPVLVWVLGTVGLWVVFTQ